MQDAFHIEQFVPLALHQSGDRYSRPPSNNPRNLLFGDLIPQQGGILLRLACHSFLRFELFLELRQLSIFQFGGSVQVVFALRLLDVRIDLFQLLPQLLYLADRVFFIFPAGFHPLELLPHLGKLLLDLFQMLP